MTSRDNRGGYRAPERPAAVSPPGPGTTENRTDGGPGSRTQPIRVASGGRYGERAASVAQQQGAPLPVGEGPSVAAGARPPGGATVPGRAIPTDGVFGPSQTMGPLTPTVSDPSMLIAEDPELFLRYLASKFPHPAIRRLVDWSAVGNNPPRDTRTPLMRATGDPVSSASRGGAPHLPGPTPSPSQRGLISEESAPTSNEVGQGFR